MQSELEKKLRDNIVSAALDFAYYKRAFDGLHGSWEGKPSEEAGKLRDAFQATVKDMRYCQVQLSKLCLQLEQLYADEKKQ